MEVSTLLVQSPRKENEEARAHTPVFKALADPTRRRILQMLRSRDLTAGEIAAAFPTTAASISHHLAVLRQAGMVEDRREGQYIVYSLNTTVFQEVLAWLMDLTGDKAAGTGHDPRTEG
ncbi:MAG: winged helix-turn-helix transcriptional regulator [Firmicutes bacterium]|nr:winged helix-turn-helix transcriptional regulator [Bacillota bacterium]